MYKYIIKHYLLKNIVKLEKGINNRFRNVQFEDFYKKKNK